MTMHDEQSAQSVYAGSFEGARVLITGGAGFIGSHLAAALHRLGAHVRVLDDLSGSTRANLEGFNVDLRIASILDDSALRDAMAGCRFVFHQAAMVSVPESVERPDQCAQINIVGTERVLEAARDAGVQRVMFASSAAVYGGAPTLPSREDQPVDCWSPYAASKAAGETLLSAFAHCYRISTVNLRYFNIFGPRQNPNSAYAAAISAFTKALKSGTQPTLHGDGKQTRDFTYIDNVVHANLLAACSKRMFRGEAMNIGTGVRVSLLEVLNVMGRAMGVNVQPTFGPPRAGDVRDSVADITKAQTLLGYHPIVDFAEGMKRTVASPMVVNAAR
ncbi:MAG TPA: NAD-dependent epimerase/dehydratase family protein [Phycisphaerales bacterium]|nr:NAD-dependent epimerase/dehydratase family protein [Phycisphaerales bacterium]